MRNPKWHRDEIILALDLYFSPDRGSIDGKNPKIIELSGVLNALPLFINRPDQDRFRNPNGVTLKLSNFLAIDPNYLGKGMIGGSNLDKIVFNEFVNQKEHLKSTATRIKEIVGNEILISEILGIEEDEQTLNDSVKEGQALYRLHKSRERNQEIVKRKKKQAILQYGKLECEICQFDFLAFYGEVGDGFIECHHRKPLSSMDISRNTTLEDLALVCANCHRVLHRNISTLSMQELKEKIQSMQN